MKPLSLKNILLERTMEVINLNNNNDEDEDDDDDDVVVLRVDDEEVVKSQKSGKYLPLDPFKGPH